MTIRISFSDKTVRVAVEINGAIESAITELPKRPWVGLTDEDWGWVADKKETALDTFAHGAAWAADILKGCNK